MPSEKPPTAAHPGEATRLLAKWHHGYPEARERLLRLVYDDMRARARWRLRDERPGHTLQTTELVHEAYLRLAGKNRIEWQSRKHFLAIAAQAMRRILVDRARRRGARKRIGPGEAVPLEAVPELAAGNGTGHGAGPTDRIDLKGALGRLARVDARQARLVELRFFAGLSIAETAKELGISPATVKREWRFAQAWLRRAMHGGG